MQRRIASPGAAGCWRRRTRARLRHRIRFGRDFRQRHCDRRRRPPDHVPGHLRRACQDSPRNDLPTFYGTGSGQTITLADGDAITGIDIALAQATSITGTVYAGPGATAPLANVCATAVDDFGFHQASAQTNPAGAYVLRRLDPARTYTVAFSPCHVMPGAPGHWTGYCGGSVPTVLSPTVARPLTGIDFVLAAPQPPVVDPPPMSSTSAPAPGPPGPPAVTATKTPALKLTLPSKLRSRAVLRAGLLLRLSCSSACSVAVAVYVPASMAKKLKLGDRRIRVAARSARLSRGPKKLVVRLSAKTRSGLTRLDKAVTLTLQVTTKGATGPPRAATRSLRITP